MPDPFLSPESFSPSAVVPFGKRLIGFDIIDKPSELLGLVNQDHGLAQHKKQSLMSMLKSPEAFDHILVGVTGMAMAHAITNYTKLPKPARILLSLAGFGIGNILYNTVHERKFTTFDPDTGATHIKL